MDSIAPRLLSAGLDYVSCTAKSGLTAERLIELGRAVLGDECAAGNERKASDWKGYQLERAGSVSVGIRREDALVTASGAPAFLYGAGLLQLADHASRVDLQVTMHSPDWNVPHLIWRARYEPDPHKREGRPIERQLIDNTRQGVTCYLGSAKSAQRGRFYDKHAESPGEYEEGSARLEIQYRNNAAEAVRSEYAAGRMDTDRIRGSVGRWFQSRGVLTALTLPAGGPIKVPAREETDYDRHRKWLRECVAPAIRRFASLAGPGDALADLGLDSGVNLYAICEDCQAYIPRAQED